MNLPIVIRPAFPEEHNFIYSSWIKSGYRSRPLETVAKEIYTLNQHDIITSLLSRCEVLVAHQYQAPENLFGYIICQKVDNVFVLHYAYVKQTFRKLGVFAGLLRAAKFYPHLSAGFYTHSTKAMSHIEHKFNLIYNPYLLSNPKYGILISMPANKVLVPDKLSADDLVKDEE